MLPACSHVRFGTVSPDQSVKTVPIKILVVDDEPDVLKLVESILKDDGYDVVTSKSGDAAIKAFGTEDPRPELLLTDVVMPGMSGPMLAEQLLQTAPQLKVLFMSGYDDRHVVQRYVVERGFRLIPKPFTVKSLRAAIHAVLKSAESSSPDGSAG